MISPEQLSEIEKFKEDYESHKQIPFCYDRFARLLVDHSTALIATADRAIELEAELAALRLKQ